MKYPNHGREKEEVENRTTDAGKIRASAAAMSWFGREFKRSYRDADKSLARPGRKQANVSVRMARISFGALPCRKK